MSEFAKKGLDEGQRLEVGIETGIEDEALRDQCIKEAIEFIKQFDFKKLMRDLENGGTVEREQVLGDGRVVISELGEESKDTILAPEEMTPEVAERVARALLIGGRESISVKTAKQTLIGDEAPNTMIIKFSIRKAK